MATTKSYKNFVLEQLSEVDGIIPENQKYHMPEEIPYQNAKPMYLVEYLDDKNKLKEIITTTTESLNQ